MLIGGDGVELAVFEWGDPTAPTVVLVHGYPDTHAVWNLVAERLADRFHVVAYDVRGAGHSGVPDTRDGYSIEHLEADLAGVVDAVSPDRPVHLVGHDWGSVQSWPAVCGDRLQGRIASFTSMSGPCLDHVGFWARSRFRADLASLRQLASQGLRSIYIAAFHLPLPRALWRGGSSGAWPAFLERVEGAAVDEAWPAPTFAADAAHGIELYRRNVRPALGHPTERSTDVPVQVVVAGDDPFVTPALLADTGRWASRLWQREVAGGHWLPRSQPDRVALWITELVDHVEDEGVRATRPS